MIPVRLCLPPLGLPEGPADAMDYIIHSHTGMDLTPELTASLEDAIRSCFRARTLEGIMEDVEWDIRVEVLEEAVLAVEAMPVILRGAELEFGFVEGDSGPVIVTDSTSGASLIAQDYICGLAAVAAQIYQGVAEWQVMS